MTPEHTAKDDMAQDPTPLAVRLIHAQRTMVLGTADPGAWTAPVYYVFHAGRFFFLSSPRSRHVIAALADGACAASIFRDSDEWREIEGLQMEGIVEAVDPGVESERVFELYIARFPTVRSLLDGRPVSLPSLCAHLRAELYAFAPRRAFYLNNAAGFATRREIRLPE